MAKIKTSVRLTKDAIRFWNAIAKKLGISNTDALELSIRDKWNSLFGK